MMRFFRQQSTNQPLLLNDDGSSTGFRADDASNAPKLYDAAVMLELQKSVCQGYLTLLTGGSNDSPEQAVRQRIDDKALTLAYASLTGGNVIDACFGARPGAANKQRDFAMTLTKEAKDRLDQVAEDDERVEKIAVEAYVMGFRTVIQMHDDISRLNFITACFCTKKIRCKAEEKLQSDFYKLEQALRAH